MTVLLVHMGAHVILPASWGPVSGEAGRAVGCLEAGLSLHEAWRELSHASVIISKGLTDHRHVHLHSSHSLVLLCHQLLDSLLLESDFCIERARSYNAGHAVFW